MTWQQIKEIVKVADQLIEQCKEQGWDEERYYTEVLRKIENSDPTDLPTDEWICAYSSMYYTGSAVHYVREGMRIMKNWIKKELNPELPKEDTK